MIMRLPIAAVAGMALVVFAVAGLARVLLIRIRVLAAVLSLPSRCRNTVLALVVVAIAVAQKRALPLLPLPLRASPCCHHHTNTGFPFVAPFALVVIIAIHALPLFRIIQTRALPLLSLS